MSDVVAALQAERRSYLARGLSARVAEVDAALAEHGVEAPKVERAADAPPAKKRPAKKAAAVKSDG